MASLTISDKARNIISRGTYETLPRYKIKKVPHNNKKLLRKKISNFLKDFTIVSPVFELLVSLNAIPFRRWSFRDLCKIEMADAKLECTKRIAEIAKRVGIVKEIKVCVGKPFTSPMASFNTIILPPESLLKPEDLPKDLKLELIDQGKISEDEWIARFVVWHSDQYVLRKIFPSQLSIDIRYIYGRDILRGLRDPKRRSQEFDAMIGHELAHCKLNHVKKSLYLEFGLQLLAWPTFGLYKLFKIKVLEMVALKQERKADLFSAKRVNGSSGLISYFFNRSHALKELHSIYPERFNALGDYTLGKDHPPYSERIKYLKSFVSKSQ